MEKTKSFKQYMKMVSRREISNLIKGGQKNMKAGYDFAIDNSVNLDPSHLEKVASQDFLEQIINYNRLPFDLSRTYTFGQLKSAFDSFYKNSIFFVNEKRNLTRYKFIVLVKSGMMLASHIHDKIHGDLFNYAIMCGLIPEEFDFFYRNFSDNPDLINHAVGFEVIGDRIFLSESYDYSILDNIKESINIVNVCNSVIERKISGIDEVIYTMKDDYDSSIRDYGDGEEGGW